MVPALSDQEPVIPGCVSVGMSVRMAIGEFDVVVGRLVKGQPLGRGDEIVAVAVRVRELRLVDVEQRPVVLGMGVAASVCRQCLPEPPDCVSAGKAVAAVLAPDTLGRRYLLPELRMGGMIRSFFHFMWWLAVLLLASLGLRTVPSKNVVGWFLVHIGLVHPLLLFVDGFREETA